MEIPKGMQFPHNTSKVCLLKKAIYRLKQAAKCWTEKFVEIIGKLGFGKVPTEPCIFTHPRGMILAIYVDDILAAAKDEEELIKVYE